MALQQLTKRELECLDWIAKGKTAEMTAVILNISPRTIKEHVKNIKRKLGCCGYFQLGMAYEKLLHLQWCCQNPIPRDLPGGLTPH